MLLTCFSIASYAQESLVLNHLLFSKRIEDSKIKSLKTHTNLENAKKYLANYQFDLAKYFFKKSHSASNQDHRLAANLGLSRIYTLNFNLDSASYFFRKAEEDYLDNSADSLKHVFRLNAILIGFLTSDPQTESKLLRFIEGIPEDNEEILLALKWYGNLLIEKKQYKKASDYLDQALKIQSKYFPDSKNHWIELRLEKAYLSFFINGVKKTLTLYEEELFPLLKKENEGWSRYLLSECYRLSSKLYYRIRDYNKVLDYNLKYLALIDEFYPPSHFRYGETYNAISNIYEKLGFYSLSSEYAKKSSNVYLPLLKSKNEWFTASILLNEVAKLRRAGEYEAAIRRLNQVLSYEVTSEKLKQYRLSALVQKSKVLQKSGKPLKALEFARKATKLVESLNEQGKKRNLFRVYYAYLEASIEVLDFESKEIKNQYNKLLGIVESGANFSESNYLPFINNLSYFFIVNNQPDSALFYTQKTLKRYRDKSERLDEELTRNELVFLVWTKYLEGLAYQKKFNGSQEKHAVEKIIKCFDQAIEWFMESKRGYKPLLDDIYFDASVSDIFEGAIETSLRLYEKTKDAELLIKAFRYMELSKSNQLLEALNRNQLIQNTRIPDSLLLSIRSSKAQISFLNNKLKGLANKGQLTENDSLMVENFNTLILENKESLRKGMLHLEKNYQNYYEANFDQKEIDVLKVQAKLKPNQAIVEYYEGKKSNYVFVISNGKVVFQRLEKLSELEISDFRNHLIPSYSGLKIDDRYKLFLNESFMIYQKTLQKPLAAIGNGENIQKLYLIPDKTMNFIPFELLLTQKRDSTVLEGYENLPYLIKDYSISYGYSASILFGEHKVIKKAKGKLLAFAPTYKKLLIEEIPSNRLSKTTNKLSQLKHNQAEIKGISQYFSGKFFTGNKATKKSFVEKVKDYDIIHLAMHGLVDNKEPKNSKLVFTTDNLDSNNDRYLHNFELYNMHIDAQLAVLSACDTGFGKLAGGEGALSIARAFTYAGARSVVMSQWPAEDESSSQIMKLFYKYLAEGQEKDQALRQAKLDYLKNAHAFKQNPFYWCNFIITGDISPIQQAEKKNLLGFIAGGIIFLILVFAICFRRLYRK